MTSRRALAAVLLVAGACGVLATRAFESFDRIRVKVVETPVAAERGSVRIVTGAIAGLARLSQPIALVAHVAGHGVSTGDAAGQGVGGGDISILIDGMPVCRTQLPARASRRVDCRVTTWGSSDRHEVRVDGPDASWSLGYLELATHHGHAGGANYVVILPRDSSHYRPATITFTALTAAVFVALLLFVAPTPFPRWAAYLHRTLAIAILTLVAAIVIAPWVSSYKVVIWTWTCALWLALLLLPRTWTVARWLIGGRAIPNGRWRQVARPAIVAAGVLVAFWMVMNTQLRAAHNGNYSGFLIITRSHFEANPLVNTRDDIRSTLKLFDEGEYDGQFMYYLAFDPLMRTFRHDPSRYRLVVDAVPYRYGRIGFSALTRLIAGNRWQTYPATMMWMILVSIGASAFLLALAAQDAGGTPLAGALVLVIPGFWRSMQAALPEPLAAALLLAGALALVRERWRVGAALFAASLLVRETGLILVTSAVVALMFSRQERRAVSIWLMAIAPVVLWRLYVAWTIYPDWGIQGLLDQPVEFGWPFRGLLELWSVVRQGTYFPGNPAMARAAVWYPVVLMAAAGTAVALAIRSPGGMTLAAVGYAIAALSLSYSRSWIDVGNSERVTYELFVVLAAITAGIRDYPRPLRIATVCLWCAMGAYTLYGSYDAELLQRVFALPG